MTFNEIESELIDTINTVRHLEAKLMHLPIDGDYVEEAEWVENQMKLLTTKYAKFRTEITKERLIEIMAQKDIFI